MMKKAAFYLRHMVRMSTRNRIRVALISAGIFLAVAVFSTGIILSDSYYRGKMAVVEEMSDHVVVTMTRDLEAEEVVCEIAKVTPAEAVEEIAFRTSQKLTFVVMEDYRAEFVLWGQIHGITTTEYALPVESEGLFLPVEPQLLEGRHLTAQDSNSHAAVVVIDELAARLLFPEESAVGKKMLLGMGGHIDLETGEEVNGAREAEIVGVVRSSAKTVNEKYRLKKALDQLKRDPVKEGEAYGNLEPIPITVQVYLPMGTTEDWYKEEASYFPMKYQMYYYEDKESFKDGEAAIGYVQENLENKGMKLNVWTKSYWMKYYKEQLAGIRRILNAVTLFLCAISGLNIMSISFFAVKERIPEIGIRKAFGAGKGDIVFQVVFEMAIVAFLVSTSAVCMSYYGCKLAEGILSERLYTAFTVRLSNGRLFLPVLIGMLEAMCSALFPALYAAGIKVTDALRFE